MKISTGLAAISSPGLQLIPGPQLELLLQNHGAEMAEQSQSSEVWGMLTMTILHNPEIIDIPDIDIDYTKNMNAKDIFSDVNAR